jgi:hypothetical protein
VVASQTVTQHRTGTPSQSPPAWRPVRGQTEEGQRERVRGLVAQELLDGLRAGHPVREAGVYKVPHKFGGR